jgi:hypothetical protein
MPLLELADCVLMVVDAQLGFSGMDDAARKAPPVPVRLRRGRSDPNV